MRALQVGVIIVDSSGRVGVFNPAAEQIFGTPADRAIGRALIESVRNFELDRRITVARQRGMESETELTHVGTLLTPDQIYTQIVNPQQRPAPYATPLQQGASMPKPALSAQEQNDVTAYLATLK